MKQHNPKGISAPTSEWTYADLVTWMSWEIVQGLTAGRSLENVVQQFPMVTLDWKKQRDEAGK